MCVSVSILLVSLPLSCLQLLVKQVPASPFPTPHCPLKSNLMSNRKPVALLPWLPSCWSFLFISSPHLAFDSVSTELARGKSSLSFHVWQVVWYSLNFGLLSFYVVSPMLSIFTVPPPPLYAHILLSLLHFPSVKCYFLFYLLMSLPSLLVLLRLFSAVDLREIQDWGELIVISVITHSDNCQTGRLDSSLWAKHYRQFMLLLSTYASIICSLVGWLKCGNIFCLQKRYVLSLEDIAVFNILIITV